jgi:hypothetical protein
MAVQDQDRVEDLLQAGRDALTVGDRETAGARFRKAAELSPYDERVWQALLEVVSEPDDEIVCLRNVLAINPKNSKAKKRLAALQPEATAPVGAAPAPPPVPAPAAVAAAAVVAAPAVSTAQIQAEAERNYAEQESRKRARRRRWRAFRNGFGQGMLVAFVGGLIGLVLSVFIYGIGQSGGILDVWFAPIRAIFQLSAGS